jgi:hypothetical protein
VVQGRTRAASRSRAYPVSVTLDRSIQPRCNIGPDEIARRRRSALVLSAVAVVVAVALVAFHVPAVGRLALFPFAAGAGVAWMQVVHRFCVAFGAFGLENFGRLGEEHKVDRAQAAVDRRRAAQLMLEGALIGALVTLAVVVAPV